ncbi:MAG: RIP metalloprotease RseP [Deltaproteobacteria bacterium]|nr:RIP metalloprotease RseP [Deltaproteobacteria bacterium]
MSSIIPFVIVLGVLIFVHEFGHFIIAKLLGVRVLKFSLGFGKKIISKKIGDTEYLVSYLPLGGYVKLFGEQPGEEIAAADRGCSFSDRPVWHRFVIVLAGPTFNLLFALLVFSLIYLGSGIPNPVPGTKIGHVDTKSAAAVAGIKPDDVIIAINGLQTIKWQDVSELVRNSRGKNLEISIQRNGQSIVLKARAKISEIKNIFGEVVETRYLLGISKKDDYVYKKTTIIGAFKAGIRQTWAYIYLTVMSLVKIIERVVPASEMGGPILIAHMAGQQMRAGWTNLLSFMAVLSVNLGIINLLPIPILDGGHLTFFTIEAMRRKPISLQAQEVMQQIGIVLLGTLMVFVFYNDIIRLFTHS